MFVNLVKACDSTQHLVIAKTLEILGASPEITQWTIKLCNFFQAVLKFGEEEIATPCSCGVKQGDSKAPILFTNTIQQTTVEIAREFQKNDIDVP